MPRNLARRPGSVVLAAEITSRDLTKAEEGGWTYGAVAQFYEIVNDRLMFFFPGSGTKTIRERGQNGRVKITDGHPLNGEGSMTIGKVLGSAETARGVEYTGFLSKTEEKLAQKVADGTLDENSMDVSAIEHVEHLVSIEEVPERSRRYVSLAKDGRARVLGITSWRWDAIGLVTESSQAMPAITRPPVLVETVDSLAVSKRPYDADLARRRLENWGGGSEIRLAAAHLARFYGEDGRLILAGQIAEPDEDGALAVNVHAIPDALDDLEERIKLSGMSAEAQAKVIAAAHETAARCLTRLGSSLTISEPGAITESGDAEIAPRTSEGTARAAADQGSDSTPKAASHMTAGPAQPPTVGSEKSTAIAAAQISHLDRSARLRAMKRCYPGVLHGQPAKSGGRPPARSRPGV